MTRVMESTVSLGAGLALVVLLVVAAGCAHTPSRYQTVADATLQRDVMQAIGAYEAARGGDSHPVLVSVRPADPQGQHQGRAYTELWVVDSKGRRSTYRVTFVPEPGAGTTYTITRLAAPAPDKSKGR